MNSPYETNPRLHDMTPADLDEVLSIEENVHTVPWTRGNFEDGLLNGNIAKVLTLKNRIIGYAVLLQTVDEVQLLNIGIALRYQRQGFGKRLLGEIKDLARENGMRRILLEVRRSNKVARDLYHAAGFVGIGVRCGYYKGAEVSAEQALKYVRAGRDIQAGEKVLPGGIVVPREDAIVMECLL